MRRYLLVAIGSFILLAILQLGQSDALTYQHPDFPLAWDHHAYIAMARGALLGAIPPYAYRVGTPALAALFANLQTGFQVVTFLSLWLTALVLYILLQPYPLAFGGVVAFIALPWTARWLFYDFWLCDGLVFLSIALALLFAVRKQPVAFAVTLAFGALNKEAVLIAAPLYATLNRDDWRRGVALTVPALAVLAGLHVAIHPLNMQPSLRLGVLPFFAPQTGGFVRDWWWTARASTWGTFGVLCLPPLLAWRQNVQRYGLALAITVAQLAVAVNTERLIALAAPLVIFMAWQSISEAVRGPVAVKRFPAARRAVAG